MRILTSWALCALALLAVAGALRAAYPSEEQQLPRESVSEQMTANDVAWNASRDLPGYFELRERFEIEEAILGSINRLEPALFVRLRTVAQEGLNVAWWWSPLVEGKPRFDWTEFLACFDGANEAVRRHIWLQEWREVSPGRSLELHSFGCAPGFDDNDLEYFVKPIWRDAGLAGEPVYELLARRSNGEWAKVFLNPSEPRALIQYTLGPDPEEKHWLDRLEVSFHPRCQGQDKNARYVTVRPNGEWTLGRFSRCEP